MKYYIYKLTFSSGATYIGQHKEVRKDNYVTSSSYYKNHPEDALLSREILIYTDTQDKANFLESFLIMNDKAYNKNNVNYNYGGLFMKFVGPTFKNRFHSREAKEKQSKAHKDRILVYKDDLDKAYLAISKNDLQKYLDLGYKRGRKPMPMESKLKMKESAKIRYKNNIEHMKLVSSLGGKSSSGTKGKKLSEETKHKMSLARQGRKINSGKTWYTDGVNNKICFECPEGYHLGFTKKKSISS